MVYLNHAATTYPKPQCVIDSAVQAMTCLPQAQYRGVSDTNENKNWIKLCRGNLARLFQVENPERIFFTSGATQSLNMAILGFCKAVGAMSGKVNSRRGIVITATEHNAVLRTIYDGLWEELATGKIYVTVAPCDAGGYVNTKDMEKLITEDTALVIVNHCSNVTGAVQDVARIGKIAMERGAVYLVDASQSAGALEIDVKAMHIDMLCFTGHKGLLGIQGCGGLYVRPGIELRSILFGGTGTDSSTMIPKTPFYEVGTANIPGIAGLNAGVEYIFNRGIRAIREQEEGLIKRLYEGMKSCAGVTVYADRQPEGTALSFNVQGLAPEDVGYILAGSYGICVRTGLHCAPLIHQYLGTLPLGTVRVSISCMTTEADVDSFLGALEELTAGM